MNFKVQSIFIFFLLVLLPAVGHSTEKKQILILNSYHKGYPWTDSVVQGIEKTLAEGMENYEILIEYMDTKRINTDEYKKAFFRLMEIKYKEIKPDIIIVSDDNAFVFAKKYHSRLFGNTPIVFVGVNNFSALMIAGHEELITGIVQDADIPATLNIALKLHPNTTRVAVICDATTTGQAYIRQATAAESQFPSLKFIYLNGAELTTSEMLARLGNLPDNSIALLCIWLKDKNGVFVPWQRGYPEISKNSTVPLYGVLESMLQYGILGGKVQSGKYHGAEAAKIALEILEGKKVADIPVRLKSPNTYMFNYEQLQRWNIEKTSLPRGSIIFNEPKSVYYQYQNIIWGLAGIFAFLIVVITILVTSILRRKSAEINLRESEEKYKSLANNLNVGIYRNTAGPDGKFIEANPAIVKMFGFDNREEFLKVKVSDLYKNSNERKEYNTKILKNTTIRNEELQLLKKDGTSFIGSISAVVVKDEKGKVEYYDGIIEDITERKRAEEALRESEETLVRSKKMESLGLLAGGVAHDLNNILSGIVSYPELILLDLPEDSKLRKPIETIQNSGHRAVAIVQDLLTVARGVAVTKEPLNLNDLVVDYLNSPEFKKLEQFHPTVTVRTNLDSDLFNIIGSHVHIRKSVMNLVSNASEAIDGSGTVTISTLNRYVDRPLRGYSDVNIGEYAILSVSDDGSGISSDALERIFEPFYTKKVMGRSGTGLGLAVVWNVVQDHKGYVDVKTGENGTTFELYFSITRDEKPDKDLTVPIKELKGNGETILIIDDVESQREISAKMLDTLGYKTKAVSSGEEAVEYLKAIAVDLLLLDMIMDPGMNGRETYEKILEIRPDQKAIIVSGFAATEEVREAQRLGAGRYIRKPISLEKIGLAVKEALAK